MNILQGCVVPENHNDWMKYILYCCHKLFFIGVKKTASALILNRYENRKKKVDSDTVGHLSHFYHAFVFAI